MTNTPSKGQFDELSKAPQSMKEASSVPKKGWNIPKPLVIGGAIVLLLLGLVVGALVGSQLGGSGQGGQGGPGGGQGGMPNSSTMPSGSAAPSGGAAPSGAPSGGAPSGQGGSNS